MAVNPVTVSAFADLAMALNKNSKDIKASTQNLKETQWGEMVNGSQSLMSLADTLKVSGPAIGVLTGKVVEATSKERMDAMIGLVNLISSPAFVLGANAFSGAINKILLDLQLNSALLLQIQSFIPPEWLLLLLGTSTHETGTGYRRTTGTYRGGDESGYGQMPGTGGQGGAGESFLGW